MSIDITIEGVSKFHVCKKCGSDDWHVNLVVKANEWDFDTDWEMYCPECQSESTIEDLIHIQEYKEKEVG